MSGFLLSEEAELDLDDAWLYIARETASADIATHRVHSIYRRFWFLAQNPYAGRKPRGGFTPRLAKFSG